MNPFGGGQTGTGGSPIGGPTTPAGQFGGDGKVGLISIGNYFKALAKLQSDPLHVLYLPGSFVAVSRMQGSLQVDEAGSIKDIRALEALYSYQYELQDSPPLELDASFVLNAAPVANALGVNVSDFYAAYMSADTYALALAFLMEWFHQSQPAATARLAAIGINPPS